MKDDNSGGEKREEDRTRDEVVEERMDNKNTINTVIKLTKEYVSFINTNLSFFLTIVPFKG